MSLYFEKGLNDNDVLYRFISERELDQLVTNNTLLRFTRTRRQYEQEEGFAFASQIQNEKAKYLTPDEEPIKKAIDQIAAYIQQNEHVLQERLDEIDEDSINKGDNECPGRKLIKEICNRLEITLQKEILSKWDDARYGIILDVIELREKLGDLECYSRFMHDSDIQYIENVCLNSSCLCCFWNKPKHWFSKIRWNVRANKVAAIKITVGELKKYLKQIHTTHYDEDKTYSLCKVEYNDNPLYMYNEKGIEVPLEMTWYSLIHPNKDTIVEMLKNLKYKKRKFKEEKEIRVIGIRLNLRPMEEDNIFFPYDKKVHIEMAISPRLSRSKENKIKEKIHKLDASILTTRPFADRITNIILRLLGKTEN